MPRYIRQLTKGGIRRAVERAKKEAMESIQKRFEEHLSDDSQVVKIIQLVREHLDKSADRAALVIKQRER